jgi:ribose transport system ATP-binding protein
VRIEGVANERIRGFGLTIEPGEIVGVAGLLGSGAEDLPYVLFGARGGSRGTVSFGGTAPLDLARLEPAKSVREGLALIPADRELLGLCLSLTVHENLTMLVQEDYYEAGRANQDKLLEETRNAIKVLSVKPNDPLARMSSLSGGNKQKVMVAKWLLRDPRLILLHEPTQGVDVGAREEIYDEIRRFVNEKGRSAVWVSSDFDELANVCDRVMVMAKGEVVDELDAQDLTGDSITAYVLAAGKVA